METQLRAGVPGKSESLKSDLEEFLWELEFQSTSFK